MPINKKRTSRKVAAPARTNRQGGVSFDITDPLLRLQIVAASCFFGEPKYYLDGADSKGGNGTRNRYDPYRHYGIVRGQLHGQKSSLPVDFYTMKSNELVERAIDDALDVDPKQTLELAVQLRNEDNLRVTPQVILVRAAHHNKVKGTGMVRYYAPMIIKRADEPATQLAYHLNAYKGKSIPNSLKKSWRDALASFDEYQLGKYRMEGRGVKTVDVVNLVHPPRTSAVDKLVRGELKTTGKTWESIISAEGSNEDTWTKALDVMGHMALLRNLRNLNNNGVNHRLFTQKLVDGAKNGKQLPFRYWSAYKQLAGAPGPILDAIEESLEVSVGNLPELEGVVGVFTDNSGSMNNHVSEKSKMTHKEVGNLMGALVTKAAEESYVGVWASGMKVVQPRKKSSIMDLTREINQLGDQVGHGTNANQILTWAITNHKHMDYMFVFSDFQVARQGATFISKLDEYRRQVNPNVQVFLINLAGYDDSILPECYPNTYLLSGWSDNLLKFAVKMAQLNS